MIDFWGCCCLLNAKIFAGDRVKNVSRNIPTANALIPNNGLSTKSTENSVSIHSNSGNAINLVSFKVLPLKVVRLGIIRLGVVLLAIMFVVIGQAQECLHEVTLNDRYMGKVACYFPNEGNTTDAYMELGLFAREFAAHTQIDDANNQVYLRRGRQVVRLTTTADIASGLTPVAGAIDYNGQSVESALGLKSNGIVYVPLNMMANLFLGSSTFDNSTGTGRYILSTYADNFSNANTAQAPAIEALAVGVPPATLNETQTQINSQVDAIANTPQQNNAQNQLGQVAQTPANAAINTATDSVASTATNSASNAVQAPVAELPTQAQATNQTQPNQAVTTNAAQTNQASGIFRIAKPRIGQHDTYTRVAIDLPVGSGYEISVKGNTFVVILPNMEALGFEYQNDDRFIEDIGYQLIDNTLALVVTTRYLMSNDGYGYRVGTLPPSATRENEVLYIDFGEEITSSAPVTSPFYATALQHHQMLSPSAMMQLKTLLQASGQNAALATTASALPATADYSQELMPDVVQAANMQTDSSQVAAVQTTGQTTVQAQAIQQDVTNYAVQEIAGATPTTQASQETQVEVQSQAIQTMIQNPVASQAQELQAALPQAQAPLQAQAPISDTQVAQTVTDVTTQTEVQEQVSGQVTAVEVLPAAAQAQAVQQTQAVSVPEEALLAVQRSAGFSVVIDPGHGGIDPGANGIVVEEEVVLDVSLRLRDLLEQYGVEVIMTREDDSSLRSSKRADLAARADQATVERNLFVSIHANAARNQDAHGVETWVFGKPLNDALLQNAINENGGGKIGVELTQEMQASFSAALLDIVSEEQLRFSKMLAESIQSQMVAKTGARNRGIKENYFYVIKNAQSPAVLVEIGFVNHPEEGQLLATDAYRDQLAEGLFEGIMGFFAVGDASIAAELANR